jgi:hypothetical protein
MNDDSAGTATPPRSNGTSPRFPPFRLVESRTVHARGANAS